MTHPERVPQTKRVIDAIRKFELYDRLITVAQTPEEEEILDSINEYEELRVSLSTKLDIALSRLSTDERQQLPHRILRYYKEES